MSGSAEGFSLADKAINSATKSGRLVFVYCSIAVLPSVLNMFLKTSQSILFPKKPNTILLEQFSANDLASIQVTGSLILLFSCSLQVGSAEECSSCTPVAGNSGEKTTLLEPTCQLQAVHDHGNQSKGMIASTDVCLVRNTRKLSPQAEHSLCIASVLEQEQNN